MTVATGVETEVKSMLSDLGLFPRGVQIDAINAGLFDGQSVMVCSPTGSGKTLVGEMALLRAITVGKRGLYLVPLRALAVQIADVLKERYTDKNVRVGLSTGDFHLVGDDLEEYDIVVTTYERADSLLRHGASWLTELGTVVIDEIQNLSAKTRGARLESTVIRLRRINEDAQIVALSATVDTPDEVAEWLGCRLIESSERPVPLTCRVITTQDRVSSVREFVMGTVQGNGQVIVFNRTRREAEAEATRLASHVGRQLTQGEKATLDNEIDSLEHWNIRLPIEVRPLLHEGVAYHHAGLDAPTRSFIEKMFERGLLRVICATTTLAAGMNLPARTVVLTNVSSPGDYGTPLSPNRVHQMLGRAGRPGRDRRGFGVILVGSRGEADDVKKRYFSAIKDEVTGKEVLIPKFETIDSVLGKSSEMPDQLLVALDFLKETTLEDVELGLFGESFLVFCATRDMKTPMRILELGEVTAESALERHALPETIRAARGGVLGTADIREVGDSVIGGMASEFGGGGVTCRFSIRPTSRGTIEGPMCSCGKPISHGILCSHLVTLGVAAARTEREKADMVIPLALSESSPSRTLIRLGLIEGTTENRLRPTHLGRIVNRLYLSTSTFREMHVLIPLTKDNSGLLWLLRHLVSLETGKRMDDGFEHLIGTVVTTKTPLSSIARSFEVSVGDLHALLDCSRWLLYCLSVIAGHGHMEELAARAQDLLMRIESRIGGSKEDESID